MSWIAGMGAVFVIAVAVFFVGRSLRRGKDHELQSVGRWLMIGAFAGLLLWTVGSTAYSSIYQIPAGHVGVVYEFGSITDQIPEGLQFVPPWRKVTVQTIQIERHIFERLEAFSVETQGVFVRASLNVRISPTAIQELYRTVGQNYFDVLIESRVAQNFKDEIVKYRSVDIAPNRETIRQAVRVRLGTELSPYSVEVVDLLLDNIDFSNEFENAIESKQIATQRALEEEQRVLIVRHQAEQAVERARGEGESLLVVARSQAEANRLLSESLTQELVQYSLIQKLADDIRVIIVPAGQSFIFDSEMLRTPPTTPAPSNDNPPEERDNHR